MSSIAVKALASLATVGGLGGAIYGAYSYNNTKDTVSNYLTKSNLIVAKQDDSGFWDKVLKTYKLESKGLEIENIDLNNSTGIKAWCDSALKREIKSKEEDIFKKASKWCVEYQTIKDKLKEKTFQSETSKLKDKLNSFIKEIQEEINAIKDGTTEEKVKKWCDDNSYRSYSEDEDKYFKDIIKNCLAEETIP